MVTISKIIKQRIKDNTGKGISHEVKITFKPNGESEMVVKPIVRGILKGMTSPSYYDDDLDRIYQAREEIREYYQTLPPELVQNSISIDIKLR